MKGGALDRCRRCGRAGVLDADHLCLAPAKRDVIARLGGSTCGTIRDRFDRRTLAEWQASRA